MCGSVGRLPPLVPHDNCAKKSTGGILFQVPVKDTHESFLGPPDQEYIMHLCCGKNVLLIKRAALPLYRFAQQL